MLIFEFSIVISSLKMGDLGPVQLRSSFKPSAPPLLHQVIAKIAQRFRIDTTKVFPFVLPEEEKCIEVFERFLLGYVRNDVDLDESELYDLESDDEELEDNLRREDEYTEAQRKEDHRSSVLRPDTRYIPEKRQRTSVMDIYSLERIDELCEQYKQKVEECQRQNKSIYGLQTKFAKAKSIPPERFQKMMEIHRDRGTDPYKYEKVQEHVWKKFQEVSYFKRN